MTENDKIRIIALDEDRVVREALKSYLEEEPGFQVHLVQGGGRVLMEVIHRVKPHLVILDLTFYGQDGLSLTREIKERFPDLPVMILSVQRESIYAEPALEAGAQGYIMKNDAAEQLLPAIHKVLEGEIYLSDSVRRKISGRDTE